MLAVRRLMLLFAFAVTLSAMQARAQEEFDYETLPAPADVRRQLPDTIIVEPTPFGSAAGEFDPATGLPVPQANSRMIWGLPNPFDGPEGGFEFGACPPTEYPGYDPPWSWQVAPDGLIYRSYLAGPREPRLAAVWNYDTAARRWVIDGTVGGRVGLLRFGNEDPLRPQGFQLDAEGAAFPRMDLQTESWDMETADFRWGLPLTYGRGPWEFKFAYYHLSSHLGDEYIVRNINTFNRINYVRDALVLGAAYRVREALRLYGEVGYSFHADGGAKPWEFQFGAEYSQLAPTGLRGSPFFAINGWLRQEVNFGGTLTAQAGWQWRGYGSGHVLRFGGQYFVGKSVAFEFFETYEQMLGIGLWYDF